MSVLTVRILPLRADLLVTGVQDPSQIRAYLVFEIDKQRKSTPIAAKEGPFPYWMDDGSAEIRFDLDASDLANNSPYEKTMRISVFTSSGDAARDLFLCKTEFKLQYLGCFKHEEVSFNLKNELGLAGNLVVVSTFKLGNVDRRYGGANKGLDPRNSKLGHARFGGGGGGLFGCTSPNRNFNNNPGYAQAQQQAPYLSPGRGNGGYSVHEGGFKGVMREGYDELRDQRPNSNYVGGGLNVPRGPRTDVQNRGWLC